MVDLNLLIVLNILLTEKSVSRTAQRLGLGPSAVSRSLAKLRLSLGDPLLVRAGAELVATPFALQLHEKVRRIVEDAEAAFAPLKEIELATLERVFTIRANDGFVERFAADLLVLMAKTAPRVALRFAPKLDKSALALRAGDVDIEIGVVGTAGPELRLQALFRDRFVGVIRADHPLAGKPVTPGDYVKFKHVTVSRRGERQGPVDRELARLGLDRCVAVVVAGFPAAMAVARNSELIANVPDRQTENSRFGMLSFPLPVQTPSVTVSQIWHPRFDRDPAHRWLRTCLREVCAPLETNLGPAIPE